MIYNKKTKQNTVKFMFCDSCQLYSWPVCKFQIVGDDNIIFSVIRLQSVKVYL